MKIRVIMRGYLRGRQVFVKSARWFALDDVEGIGEAHAKEMTAGEIDMIELEFPDFPINERYFRLGTNPAGMVMPMEINLGKRHN